MISLNHPGAIQMKLKILILLTTLCLIASVMVRASEEKKKEASHDQLIASLYDAFMKLGSFEAEYRLSKDDISHTLRLIRSDEKKYYLIQLPTKLLKNSDADNKYMILVLDYSVGESLLVDTEDNAGLRIQFSVIVSTVKKEMLKLFQILGIGFKGLSAEKLFHSSLKSIAEFRIKEWKTLGDVEFKLTSDQIQVLLGATTDTSGGRTKISWLLPGLFSSAEKVIPEESVVRLVFPENHEIHIQRKSGLLQKDIWFRKDKNPRQLELVRVTPVKKEISYTERIPLFDRIDFTAQKMADIRYRLGHKFILDFSLEFLRTMGVDLADTNWKNALQLDSSVRQKVLTNYRAWLTERFTGKDKRIFDHRATDDVITVYKKVLTEKEIRDTDDKILREVIKNMLGQAAKSDEWNATVNRALTPWLDVLDKVKPRMNSEEYKPVTRFFSTALPLLKQAAQEALEEILFETVKKKLNQKGN